MCVAVAKKLLFLSNATYRVLEILIPNLDWLKGVLLNTSVSVCLS